MRPGGIMSLDPVLFFRLFAFAVVRKLQFPLRYGAILACGPSLQGKFLCGPQLYRHTVSIPEVSATPFYHQEVTTPLPFWAASPCVSWAGH